MKINAEWVKKDFKQKYFLYCRDKKISENLTERFGSLNNYSYLAKQIEIKDYDKDTRTIQQNI